MKRIRKECQISASYRMAAFYRNMLIAEVNISV